VTRPVPDIVATEVLLLLQVPPVVVDVSRLVPPLHSVVVPLIAAGNPLTVTNVVVKQPELKPYVIVVFPAATPVTKPVDVTVAAAGKLELHVPPDAALLNDNVEPTQTGAFPVIGETVFVIVTTVVEKQAGLIA
jgi:hypothetical protein